MTSQWAGYLFKAIKGSASEIFPHHYIQFDSWDSSPKQREEVKAWRDDYTRELFRVTANGQMSTFSFKIRPNLHEADIVAIYDFFERFELDQTQRNIQIEYWNNESHSYSQGIFYRPNPKFQIRRITPTDIIYKEQTIEFVQAKDV